MGHQLIATTAAPEAERFVWPLAGWDQGGLQYLTVADVRGAHASGFMGFLATKTQRMWNLCEQ